ncbi:MAG: penicillin acylase family protein [Pyrinomonadaceae bacterium]
MKILILICVVAATCVAAEAHTARIVWDKWDVPHISGRAETDVYYGFGWAQMEAHADLILRMYGRSRAESAAYWGGPENLQRDIAYRKLAIPRRAQEWLDSQDPDMTKNVAAFVAGMNDYCARHADRLDPDNKVVLPVRLTDPLAQLQVSYHLLVGGFALQPQAAQWQSAGSNAWAVAPKRSESGTAMLMFQPHPPWANEYRFFEAHLNGGGTNFYGITLLGLPMIAMGFNEHLGWGMTFNQADAMDLIEVSRRGDEYEIDGEWRKFIVSDEQVAVKNAVSQTVRVKRSDLGMIVEEKEGKALILRLSGLDRPFLLAQFRDMTRSVDLGSFQKALKMLQLPLQNIIYADKKGNIFYLYNGIIPKRPNSTHAEWSGIIPSTKPGALVREYLSYEQLPKMINPRSGFISNSNNDPWTSTFPFELDPRSYPAYVADNSFDLRSASSVRHLTSRPKLSFDSLVSMQSSTHSELADRAVPELVEFAKASGNAVLQEAAKVLSEWDRKMEPDSKGAVLFANWYFSTRRIKQFEIGFSADDPLRTPRTLTVEARSRLSEAARQTLQSYGTLDVAWGDVYYTESNGVRRRGGLGLGEIGSINAGFYRRDEDGRWALSGGAAYTAVVEFGRRVRSKGILSYGNVTERKPSGSDQTQLMIDRRVRDIFFYPKEIDANKRIAEVLRSRPAR